MLASFTICLLHGSDRLYAWQFVSFPLGVWSSRSSKLLPGFHNKNKISLLFLMLLIICVIIKKTPYVEFHELGFLDTILQIAITLLLGAIILINKDIARKSQFFSKLLSFLGEYSYEIYLSHVLTLEWFIKHNYIVDTLFYALITVVFTFIIAIFSKVIIRMSILRGKYIVKDNR
jgi:peptidoglycan/LPS O-acetylase OafA/YrhL